MAVEVSRETRPAVVFVVQVLVGTALYSLIMLAAFGLAKLVGWMEQGGAPSWMIHGAHWAEWALFWLDLFCFGLFLLSEALKFVRGLLAEWRD